MIIIIFIIVIIDIIIINIYHYYLHECLARHHVTGTFCLMIAESSSVRMVTVQWSVLFAVRFSSNSGLEKPLQTISPLPTEIWFPGMALPTNKRKVGVVSRLVSI